MTAHIVSFSGGKDSTALLLRLLEENFPVDDIVFFDTGWEFPQMHQHVDDVESYIGRKITRLQPKKPFTYWMFERENISRSGENKGEITRVGNGWPSPMRRWCTREKVTTIDRYCKKKYGLEQKRYVGFAADEIKRTGCGNACSGEERYGVKRLYPLIFEWDMDEAACLQYCKERGFDWGGLYDNFTRVSCFCCPLQRIGDLKTLYKKFPELWNQMVEWDRLQPAHNQGFRMYQTVHDLDRIFKEDDRQLELF